MCSLISHQNVFSQVWQRLKTAVLQGIPEPPDIAPLRGGGPVNYARFDQLEVSSEGDMRDAVARSEGFEDYDSLVSTREALENTKHKHKTLHQDWLREHDRACDQEAAHLKEELDLVYKNKSLCDSLPQPLPTKWMHRLQETRAKTSKQAAAAASGNSGEAASSTAASETSSAGGDAGSKCDGTATQPAPSGAEGCTEGGATAGAGEQNRDAPIQH